MKQRHTANRLLRVVDKLADTFLPLASPPLEAGIGCIAVRAVDDGWYVEGYFCSKSLDLGFHLSEPEVAAMADLGDLGGVEGCKTHIHESSEGVLDPGVDAEAARELELECWMQFITAASEFSLDAIVNIEK